MTPSGRRSIAISRSSQLILRNAGFVSATAAFPLMFRLPTLGLWRTFFLIFPTSSSSPWNAGTHTPCSLVVTRWLLPFQSKNRRWLWVSPRSRGRQQSLPRRHADRAVEADGLAVQHRVLHDVDREVTVFGRIAEPRRMRHLRAETLQRLLIQSHQQRRQEQAGRDGVDADLVPGEVARRRQGQADYAALRGRIRDLADLAFIGRDARGVDDDATLFADEGFRDQPLGEQPQHVESADQVDVDDAGEFRQRIDAVLADDALRSADGGTIHQHARDAMRGLRLRDSRLDLLLVGD